MHMTGCCIAYCRYKVTIYTSYTSSNLSKGVTDFQFSGVKQSFLYGLLLWQLLILTRVYGREYRTSYIPRVMCVRRVT